jgi:hypothetical protein
MKSIIIKKDEISWNTNEYRCSLEITKCQKRYEFTVNIWNRNFDYSGFHNALADEKYITWNSENANSILILLLDNRYTYSGIVDILTENAIIDKQIKIPSIMGLYTWRLTSSFNDGYVKSLRIYGKSLLYSAIYLCFNSDYRLEIHGIKPINEKMQVVTELILSFESIKILENTCSPDITLIHRLYNCIYYDKRTHKKANKMRDKIVKELNNQLSDFMYNIWLKNLIIEYIL